MRNLIWYIFLRIFGSKPAYQAQERDPILEPDPYLERLCQDPTHEYPDNG